MKRHKFYIYVNLRNKVNLASLYQNDCKYLESGKSPTYLNEVRYLLCKNQEQAGA